MSIEAPRSTHHDAETTVLTASRALLGMVARSLSSALEIVTLPQFRVLVLLSSNGAMRTGALAERMNTHPSTFTRSMDKIVAAGWVTRTLNPESRREIIVELTPEGQQLVDSVTRDRREEIRRVLEQLSEEQTEALVAALSLFNTAARETQADDLLTLGL